MNFFHKRRSIFHKVSPSFTDASRCNLAGHGSKSIVAICTFQSCTETRLMCSKCLQTIHKRHNDSHIKIDELLDGKNILKQWPPSSPLRSIGKFLYRECSSGSDPCQKSLEAQIDEFFKNLTDTILSKIEEAKVLVKSELLDGTVSDGMKLSKLLSRFDVTYGLKDIRKKIEEFMSGIISTQDTEKVLGEFFSKIRHGDEENLMYLFNSIKNKPNLSKDSNSSVNKTRTTLEVDNLLYEACAEQINSILDPAALGKLLGLKKENFVFDETMIEQEQTPSRSSKAFARLDFMKPIYQIDHAHLDQITNVKILSIPSLKESEGQRQNVNQKPLDHYLITTSEDKSIKVWNLSTKKQEYCIEQAHSDWVLSLAIIELTKEEMKLFKKPIQYLMITGSTDGSIRFWDWAKGKMVNEIQNAHQGWISQLELLTVDQKQLITLNSKASLDITKLLVSASWDKVIKIWDWTTCKCLKVIQTSIKTYTFTLISYEHKPTVLQRRSILGSRRFSLADSRRLLPSINSLNTLVVENKEEKPAESGYAIANAGWGSNIIKIWDWLKGECIRELKGKCERYNSLISLPYKEPGDNSPDKERQLLAAAGYYQSHCIEIWDWEKGTCLKIIENAHNDWIKSLKVMPIKKSLDVNIEWALVSGGNDNSLKFWSINSDNNLISFDNHFTTAREGALLPWTFQKEEEKQCVLFATYQEGHGIVILGEEEL